MLSTASSSELQGKASLLFRVAVSIFVVLFLGLFATNLDIYLSIRGLLPVNSIAILLGAFCAFLALITASGQLGLVLNLFCEAVMRLAIPIFLLIAWIVIHVLDAARTVTSGPDTDFTRIFPILQFVLFLFGIVLANLQGSRSGAVRLGLGFAIALLGSSVIAETIFPEILGTRGSGSSYRPGGVALNANLAAFILSAALACFLDFRRRRGSDLVLLVLVLTAVICTLSRSGLVQFFIVAIIYFLFLGARVMSHGGPGRLRFALGFLVIPLFVFAIIAAIGPLLSAGPPEIQERVEQLTFRGDAVYEDPYRYMLLEYYVRLALEHPFVGFGTAYIATTAEASAPLGLGPHSMFLSAWVDHGLVGLVLYIGVLLSLLMAACAGRNVNGVLLVLLVIASSFFSHDSFYLKATHLFAGIALGQTFPRRERW